MSTIQFDLTTPDVTATTTSIGVFGLVNQPAIVGIVKPLQFKGKLLESNYAVGVFTPMFKAGVVTKWT